MYSSIYCSTIHYYNNLNKSNRHVQSLLVYRLSSTEGYYLCCTIDYLDTLQTLYLGYPDFVLGLNAHRHTNTQQINCYMATIELSTGTHVDGTARMAEDMLTPTTYIYTHDAYAQQYTHKLTTHSRMYNQSKTHWTNGIYGTSMGTHVNGLVKRRKRCFGL